jgi:hypothetical protein
MGSRQMIMLTPGAGRRYKRDRATNEETPANSGYGARQKRKKWRLEQQQAKEKALLEAQPQEGDGLTESSYSPDDSNNDMPPLH